MVMNECGGGQGYLSFLQLLLNPKFVHISQYNNRNQPENDSFLSQPGGK